MDRLERGALRFAPLAMATQGDIPRRRTQDFELDRIQREPDELAGQIDRMRARKMASGGSAASAR
jgi:hypothetical protein